MRTKTKSRSSFLPPQVRSQDVFYEHAFKAFVKRSRLTVSEWAEKNRHLSRETSSEPGLWRTSRTPYLKEPMDAISDPNVHKVTIVAASQVGKTEVILNGIGSIIDQDPGTILFIHPSLEEARKFSHQRLRPMFRDCPVLKGKVADEKAKATTNTKLMKTFPGGTLSLIGSNTPAALASIPVKYLFGDEHDRFARSAGSEGDPWALAERRQTTFYNAKAIDVSTPTIKGASPIEVSFYKGTQERWCHKCPTCGEWVEIDFDDIKFEHTSEKISGRKSYKILDPIYWECPKCGSLHAEDEMRRQPAKWIAANPAAYENGVRSFWLNAFSSPWTPWKRICQAFLDAKDDPLRLKVVWNTLLGKLWEERGDIADEDVMMSRREVYDAEVPDGVLVLTMGVDTQDNRLEYEVVGYGQYGETWGIKKGFIMGQPDLAETWNKLDGVIDRVFRRKDGKGLKISMTMVDSGGHYTQDVYKACKQRMAKRVFPIKGKGGEGLPFTSPPHRIPIKDRPNETVWLYNLGVDAGKAQIMSNLKVGEPGAKYCHFPLNESAGYNSDFFSGLLSERLVLTNTKRGQKWVWEKISSGVRNEALDCRNYANAGFNLCNPNLDAIERRLKGLAPARPAAKQRPRPVKKHRSFGEDDDW